MSAPVESSPDPARRRATWLFLAAVLLNGLTYLLTLTPWMGEDEPWQLEYASYVADGYLPWGGTEIRPAGPGEPDPRSRLSSSQLQVLRKFGGMPEQHVGARQREILASMEQHGFYSRADWAGVESERASFDMLIPNFTSTTQPPLYYLLAGNWLRLTGAQGIEARLWSARVLSLLLYVLAAWVGLAFARTLLDDERAALCAAALFAFLPMSARQAAVVSNDVLAKLLAVSLLWIAARWLTRRARPWELGAGLLLCLLVLLTKTTAIGAAAALLLALVLRSGRVSARMGPLLAIGAGLALAGWAALRFVFQGNPAFPRTVWGFMSRLDTGFSAQNLGKFTRTLAGSFGWESRFLPGALNVALALLVVFALWRCARGGARLLPRPRLLWCALAVGIQVLLIVLRGVAVGRYMMPMLPALAVLLVAGLVLAAPESGRERAARRFVLLLVAFNAYFLWGGLVVHETLLLGQ